MRAPRTLMSTTTTCVLPKRAVTGSARCTRETRRSLDMRWDPLNDKQKGRAVSAALRQMRIKSSLLMLHGTFDRERPLAGLVVNAEDRILVELHQELRLEGSGVAAGIVEDGA